MQPCPRPLELRHADGTARRERVDSVTPVPSRSPFSEPVVAGGNRSNISIKTRPVSRKPSPIKDTDWLLPGPSRSAPSRSLHL
ncbi:hypothetical protein B0T18DRAFT_400335 [Schizothecium vesticola]|uniref:Uncharacterized protein n=1 Tax=Schizothecium vesticola TaxID=314040 RepID=A0AA40FBX2_9PEZI|nr:hypothetical protein B0T18DRAFT_400335 [Schizothecium vesticola]